MSRKTAQQIQHAKMIRAKEGYNIKIELASVLGLIMSIISTVTGFLGGDIAKGLAALFTLLVFIFILFESAREITKHTK